MFHWCQELFPECICVFMGAREYFLGAREHFLGGKEHNMGARGHWVMPVQ